MNFSKDRKKRLINGENTKAFLYECILCDEWISEELQEGDICDGNIFSEK